MAHERVMSVRLSDAQFAELHALGGSPSAEMRRRAFPPTTSVATLWISPWFVTLSDGSQIVLEGNELGRR
jgi:hypothetical protein